jgi:uncharacterized cupredoxin-like copper-binding protein
MRLARLSLLLALPAVLAACGSDGRSSRPRPNQVLLTEYKFNPRDLTVKVGTDLSVRNDGQLAHDLTLEQPGSGRKLLGTEVFISGSGGKLRVALPPGRYRMVCTVPGHARRGMVGVLRIR